MGEIFTLNTLLSATVIVTVIGYVINTVWKGYLQFKKNMYDKIEKLDEKLLEKIDNKVDGLERKRKEDCADRRQSLNDKIERVEADLRECKRRHEDG